MNVNSTLRDRLRREERERQIIEGTLVPLPDALHCGDGCELSKTADGTWLLVGYNQGGYDLVSFLVLDLFKWIKANKPDLLEESV